MPFIQKVCIIFKMRLIFPRINGLLSSYMPQILLQIQICSTLNLSIIARKYANCLVQHTAVCLNTFLLWNNRNQYKNHVQLFCSSNCLPLCPFFAVRCLRWCQAHVQAVLWAAFCHANNIDVKSAILLILRHSHLLSVHHNVQFTVRTCGQRTVLLPHPNNCHF